MSSFKFVPKNEYIKVKNEIIDLISYVQKELKSKYTFSYIFIGPCAKNMITIDVDEYIGFDFNLRIIVNNNELDSYKIKEDFIKIINNYLRVNNNDECKDSNKYIEIKLNDPNYLVLKHSLDIEIGRIKDDRLELIKKQKDNYFFEKEKEAQASLNDKYNLLIECGLKEFIKYQYLKRRNNSKNKKSINIYEETIAAIYHEFYDNDKSFL